MCNEREGSARVHRMAKRLFERVNTRVTPEHDGVPFFFPFFFFKAPPSFRFPFG